MSVFKDNFNRANNTDLGANWDEAYGAGRAIDANALFQPAGSSGVAFVAAITLGAGQYIQAIAATIPSTCQGMLVRGSFATNYISGYGVEMYSGNIKTVRYIDWTFGGTSGAPSRVILDDWSGTFVNGDLVRLEIVGTAIKVYLNSSLIATVTDATIAGPGQVGVYGSYTGGTAGKLDDLECGDWPLPQGGGGSPFRVGNFEGLWNRGMGHP